MFVSPEKVTKIKRYCMCCDIIIEIKDKYILSVVILF